MNFITFSKDELSLIREACFYESGSRNPLVQPGYRFNIDRPEDFSESINIALATDDPDWDDTELQGHGDWSDVRSPIALTDDGRCWLDLYCYTRHGLRGNVVVIADSDGLKSLHPSRQGDAACWERK